MPVITFENQNDFPEGLRDIAVKDEATGKWSAKVVSEDKVEQFRANNISLLRERDTLQAMMTKLKPLVGESVDDFITRFNELEGTAKKVKDGQLKTSDAVEAEVENRVQAMKTDLQSQLNAEAAKRAASDKRAEGAEDKLRRSIIERYVTEAVINEASGAAPSALKDILTRAYNVFHVEGETKVVIKDGELTRIGVDGITPMTPLEWLAGLRKEAPHLFKASNGGGASGGGQGGGSGGTGQMEGLTKEEIDKLSPMAKLQLVHRQKARQQAQTARH